MELKVRFIFYRIGVVREKILFFFGGEVIVVCVLISGFLVNFEDSRFFIKLSFCLLFFGENFCVIVDF